MSLTKQRGVFLLFYFRTCIISRSIQRSTTGVTKAVVCLWNSAYKRNLAANRKGLPRTESLAIPDVRNLKIYGHVNKVSTFPNRKE